jgi:hypothetical protein
MRRAARGVRAVSHARAAASPPHPTPPPHPNPTLPLSSSSLLLQGFDEFMNVVLDEAEELNLKTKKRTPLGRILLKGDNITSILAAPSVPAPA